MERRSAALFLPRLWPAANRLGRVQGFPKAQEGMVVGLLGGSFGPAHGGHVHITREAIRRVGLDRVWWLVSPGNPLKARQPAPMVDRLARAMLGDDPRVVVSDLEQRLGTRATVDTLRRLQAIYPGLRLVLLMGADNLVQFHRQGVALVHTACGSGWAGGAFGHWHGGRDHFPGRSEYRDGGDQYAGFLRVLS